MKFKEYCDFILEINNNEIYKKLYKMKCYNYLAFLFIKDKHIPYGLEFININQKEKILFEIISKYCKCINCYNFVNKYLPVSKRNNTVQFDCCITDNYINEYIEVIQTRNIFYLNIDNFYYLSNNNFIKLFLLNNTDYRSRKDINIIKCIKNKTILNNFIYYLNNSDIYYKYKFILNKSKFNCNKNCYCDDLQIYLINYDVSKYAIF